MRYYKIEFTNPKDGKPVLPGSLGKLGITSLLPDGQHNPSALNIDFDIPFIDLTSPVGGAWLKIWGLGLQDLKVPNLAGTNIKISAGMSKGLPLADPSQQGLILSGAVMQAFGNWIGPNMTLDVLFQPAFGTPEIAKNFAFNWKAGTKMSEAIEQTLKTALPDQKRKIFISDNIVQNHDEAYGYTTLSQFAQWAERRSIAIINKPDYLGVMMTSDGQTVIVADGTFKADAKTIKEIRLVDLIGQPTWIGVNQIVFQAVLRGDLSVSQTIKIPPTLFTTTGPAFSQFGSLSGQENGLNSSPQNKSLFTGNYIIQTIHHYGSFRQPDASAWNTTVTAVVEPK